MNSEKIIGSIYEYYRTDNDEVVYRGSTTHQDNKYGTILENVTFFKKEKDIDFKKVADVLNFAELNNFVSQFKEKLNYQINERASNLSGGQIQRIAIARSLYLSPEILICDEFTSSLDEKIEEKILESVKKLVGKITIVYISHNPKLIEIADKTINLVQLESQPTKLNVS